MPSRLTLAAFLLLPRHVRRLLPDLTDQRVKAAPPAAPLPGVSARALALGPPWRTPGNA
jgi:hypothetical protein